MELVRPWPSQGLSYVNKLYHLKMDVFDEQSNLCQVKSVVDLNALVWENFPNI